MDAETVGDIIDILIGIEEDLSPIDADGYVWLDGYGYPAAEEEEA